jgi:hypothetical protein
LFHGGKIFHIVRPIDENVEDDRMTYQLVGEAYVVGHMHGEVDELGLDTADITLV